MNVRAGREISRMDSGGAVNQDKAPEVQGERRPSARRPRRTKAKRPKAKANESQVNEGQGEREPSATESQVRTLYCMKAKWIFYILNKVFLSRNGIFIF